MGTGEVEESGSLRASEAGAGGERVPGARARGQCQLKGEGRWFRGGAPASLPRHSD